MKREYIIYKLSGVDQVDEPYRGGSFREIQRQAGLRNEDHSGVLVG